MKTARLLLAYVRRSNAIERLRSAPTHPIFRQHLAAATLVAAVPPTVHLTPADIHAVIMPGLLPRYRVGRYRENVELVAGKTCLPKAWAVPMLMREYESLAAGVPVWFDQGKLRGDTLRDVLRYLFYLGLIIHPFVNGNGRTFRLYHNYLRQRCGLSWEQYRVRGWEWVVHLCRLRACEKQFKKERPELYKPPVPP